MLRVLDRWRRRGAPGQLELTLPARAIEARAPSPIEAPAPSPIEARAPRPSEPPPIPDDPAHWMLERLRALGLRGIARCTLTTNRATMVSFRDDALRVHRAFLTAPEPVLRAVVGFVNGRGAKRRAASRVLRTFEVPRAPESDAGSTRRPRTSHPDDAQLVARLRAAHQALNRERFDGALGSVAIRVSRRMRSRLGHYSPGGALPPEICIGRRHVRRDGWASVLETLVHEMVHQWQHETSRPVAHDRDFRAKARAVGTESRAKRRR